MAKPGLENIIKPAQHLDLVFGAHEEEYRVDIRGTIIYDVYPEERYFLVAQTQSPFVKSMVGDAIECTFLWHPTPTDHPSRYAFYTTIQDLITNYVLSRGNQVQAIRLAYPRYLYERNIRFSYRVQPIKQYSITLWVEGHKDPLPIIDISEGGLCFSYSTKLSHLSALKLGNRFYIALDFNGEKLMKKRVEVIRKFQKTIFPKIDFMGIKFLELSTSECAFLSAVIKRVERIILRKRSGL